MGWTRTGVVCAALLMGQSGVASAHGTGARVVANTATVVELYYTDGEPMAYAEVKVYSPEAHDVPFVNGRADKLGRVTFAADQDGLWRIEAHDNEGHTVRIEVTVTAGNGVPRQGFGRNPWLLWASLFVNVFAAVSWVEMWRRGRKLPVLPRHGQDGKMIKGVST